MSMYSLLLCCWKRVFTMTSAFSWQNFLAFALLHSIFQGQIYLLPQVFLDFLLLRSSPLNWKGHLFWMLVLNGLGGLHRTVELQLLPFSHPQILYLNEQIITCFPPYFTPVFPFIFILNVWSIKNKENMKIEPNKNFNICLWLVINSLDWINSRADTFYNELECEKKVNRIK